MERGPRSAGDGNWIELPTIRKELSKPPVLACPTGRLLIPAKAHPETRPLETGGSTTHRGSRARLLRRYCRPFQSHDHRGGSQFAAPASKPWMLKQTNFLLFAQSLCDSQIDYSRFVADAHPRDLAGRVFSFLRANASCPWGSLPGF